jgi:hypothetical protein
MDFELIALVGAVGGGVFGAAIGGLFAFVFTGFMVLIGVGVALAGVEFNFLGTVAFGPVFGPHISFAGGVAAVAYAARQGRVENGARDIALPVASLGVPAPLLVGGIFGAAGYVCNWFLQEVLTGADWTDTVALTVALSAIAVRLIFGRTGMFGSFTRDPGSGSGRMSVSSDSVWVGYQAQWVQTAALGLGAGILSAYAVVAVADLDPVLANGSTRFLMFGVSAVSLALLQFGQSGPVTHHMSLPAGVAAGTIMVAGGDPGVALALGTLAGVAGGLIGEAAARVFLIHGDTHIDPPAIAIAIMTGFVLLLDALF